MASFDGEVAVAFGNQATEGTIDPTIDALASPLDTQDGLVLGNKDSGGIAESGIDFRAARAFREAADIAGSFTEQASTFLSERLDLFSISWQFKGNGAIATVTIDDAEFDLDLPTVVSAGQPGIDTLLQMGGLNGGAWVGGIGWEYLPESASIGSAKFFWSGMAWKLKDLLANLSFAFAPGDVIIATATISGKIDGFELIAFPTLDFGNQASISAPVIESVAHGWGGTRGFEELTIEIDNQLRTVKDSNVDDGEVQSQSGRIISATGSIYADSGDIDFERSELIKAVAPTDALTFTVGAVATDTNPITACRFTLTNPEVRSVRPKRPDTRAAHEVELVAVDNVANGEFSLILL